MQLRRRDQTCDARVGFKPTIYILVVLALATIGASSASGAVSSSTKAAAETSSQSFDLQKLAEGVYAAIRKEPPGLMFNANIVFIINDNDVVVVDTNITPSSARESLAALRKLTAKPVKYVVNTHWHPDHISGNQVYRDEFPGVEFIAQATTLEDLPAVGESNRKGLLTNGPRFATQLRSLVEKKKSLTGEDLTEEERAGYLSDAGQLEALVKEAPDIQIMLPTITIEDRLTLRRGDRVIDIRFLGRAHTRADLVVHLPKEGIVITGDIVVWPVPLVGSTSYPLDYGATLEKLLALKASIIVPGHGKVLRDDSYVQLMVRLLSSVKQQTEAAAARGETLEQTRKSVNLDEFRKAFAGDSRFKRFIFDAYVTDPAVEAAFKHSSKK
ncbi:MAG TPA: MBL fold metallo-hydrolase [Blastocatellia bacterium]|nr:MBL fold metallo-hydrolase [Blastocatellia bacterium]